MFHRIREIGRRHLLLNVNHKVSMSSCSSSRVKERALTLKRQQRYRVLHHRRCALALGDGTSLVAVDHYSFCIVGVNHIIRHCSLCLVLLIPCRSVAAVTVIIAYWIQAVNCADEARLPKGTRGKGTITDIYQPRTSLRCDLRGFTTLRRHDPTLNVPISQWNLTNWIQYAL